MNRVARWIRGNIDEIAADRALRIFGGLLAAQHVLTFLAWKTSFPAERFLGTDSVPLCWPFFENCADYRFLGAAGVRSVLWAYLAAGLVATALFSRRRLAAPAYFMLLALNLFKALIWMQDYRLRMNQHYMAFFLVLVFLFLPGKRRLLQYQIVAFYFWAGTLKINPEWFSGAALYRKPLGVPLSLVPASCTYVVFLELLISFGMLARHRLVFWASFAQFALFHVVSFTVVGFFYPLLMFTALAIFPLARLVPSPEPPVSVDRLFSAAELRSTHAYLAGFSLLQVLPLLFPGDTAITGEGRLFALHMFDAQVVCNATATVRGSRSPPERVPILLPLAARIRCDPIVYLSAGRDLCRRSRAARPDFTDLDVFLESRRRTDRSFRPVIDHKDFCSRTPTYDLWRHNVWIRP